jgi:hypothetical protein
MSRLLLPAALLLSLVLCAPAHGQDWDDVSWPVLSARHMPEAPGAKAVVLFDRGTLTIDQLFRHQLERHCRIKVLVDDPGELAEVRIPFRHDETINRLRAQTILPNRERVELDKKAIHHENAGAWQFKSFTFPDVRAGAVLEFKYEIRSENLERVSPWLFQHDAFTKESEFKVRMPIGMTYDAFFNAHQLVTPRPVKSQVLDPEVLGATLQQISWTMTDIPPLEPEPLMSCVEDHRTALYFQVIGFESNQTRRTPSRTWQQDDKSQRVFRRPWEEIGTELATECEELLRSDRAVRDLADRVAPAGTSPEEAARALYHAVRDEIRTEASPATIGFGIASPKDVVKAARGNGLEKNLLLASLLRERGLETELLLISTRTNGAFRDRYHNPEQFDHGIVRAQVGNKTLLLDASDPYCPFGVLPPNDLVSAGLLLSPTNARILDLDGTGVASARECRTNAVLEGDGALHCITQLTLTGYHGICGRRSIAEDGELAYARSLLEPRFGHIDLESAEAQGTAEGDSALVLTVDYRIPDYAQNSGNLVRMRAPTVDYLEASAFTSETRTFPIEYSFPWTSEEMVKLTVPEGFRFVELPPDKRSRIGAISVDRKCKVQDTTLYFRRRFVLEDVTIPENEYSDWRNLYAETMGTEQGEVVLQGRLAAG